MGIMFLEKLKIIMVLPKNSSLSRSNNPITETTTVASLTRNKIGTTQNNTNNDQLQKPYQFQYNTHNDMQHTCKTH